MALEQLTQVLKAVGLPDDQLEALAAMEAESPDFKPETYAATLSSGIEERIKNNTEFWESLNEENVNPAFKKKIEAQQYGRAANIMRGKTLKALNLKEEDLGDLSEDEKKNVELYVTKAIQKHLSTNDSASGKLQADLIAERSKYETLENSFPEKETAIRTQAKAAADADKLSFIVLSELASIENLPVPAKLLAPALIEKLSSKYNFVVEGFEASPRQKENATLKVLDGNKVLTLGDILRKTLTEDGVSLDKKADEKESKKGSFEVDPDNTGGLKISSHILDKMKSVNG